jgi:hypothetical protein
VLNSAIFLVLDIALSATEHLHSLFLPHWKIQMMQPMQQISYFFAFFTSTDPRLATLEMPEATSLEIVKAIFCNAYFACSNL